MCFKQDTLDEDLSTEKITFAKQQTVAMSTKFIVANKAATSFLGYMAYKNGYCRRNQLTITIRWFFGYSDIAK